LWERIERKLSCAFVALKAKCEWNVGVFERFWFVDEVSEKDSKKFKATPRYESDSPVPPSSHN